MLTIDIFFSSSLSYRFSFFEISISIGRTIHFVVPANLIVSQPKRNEKFISAGEYFYLAFWAICHSECCCIKAGIWHTFHHTIAFRTFDCWSKEKKIQLSAFCQAIAKKERVAPIRKQTINGNISRLRADFVHCRYRLVIFLF